jgi:hypothetical protein
LPLKIREIDLIKYNPNMFHVDISDLNTGFQILGGASWAATTATGGLFGYWHYLQKLKS